MTKEDLKYGNVVELRNGNKYLVIRKLQCNKMRLKSLDDGIYEISINEFDNQLKYETYIDLCCSNRFDVMKVYKDYTCQELLWERKEPIKLTEDEKVILRNIDEEFKYIARDNNGLLYIYKNKPDKTYDLCWGNGRGTCFGFKHLFQFIQWTDDEPYLIEDLLEEK